MFPGLLAAWLAFPQAALPTTGPFVPGVVGRPVFLPGAIGLVQYDADAHFGDYEANFPSLVRLAMDAVRKGAKIIVFPEGSSYGYSSRSQCWCRPGMPSFKGKACRDVSQAAEKIPGGRSARFWSEFSRRYGVFVLFSVPEADGGKFYNTLGVAGPSGYAGKYRKRLLYDLGDSYASEGREPVVLDTPYGRFGLMICMDAWKDTPLFGEYKRLGVNALILSMDWGGNPSGDEAARIAFQARARNNGVDIYAADSAAWDGTGKYPASGSLRERSEDLGVGVSGVTVHSFQY
jgi:predicted amidohydrolase